MTPVCTFRMTQPAPLPQTNVIFESPSMTFVYAFATIVMQQAAKHDIRLQVELRA